uniref:Uncharacterized protein n=1 Tax=Anguilla anguilla TaxID=7936 RepID=A0A0E9VWB2_ANGAN
MVTVVYEPFIYKLNMIYQDHLFLLYAVKISYAGILCTMGISTPYTPSS